MYTSKSTSVIIVTYNHKKHIKNCLDSIFNNDKDLDIIIVDNSSTDGTPDLIEHNFPEVTLIRNSQNKGYGAAVNLGVNHSKREYIVILNPDVTTEANFIEELVKPIVKDSKLITTPKALLYDGSRINTCGNIEHFMGLAFTRGLGCNRNEYNELEFMNGLSGVCFALKRELYLKIGGFDENIFLYMEDVELSWKINSMGLKILCVPNSIIYHDYSLKVPAEKIYYLERGRYIILRKYLTWKQYLMFLPSLLLTEIITFGYAFLNGQDGIKFKLKAIKEGLNVKVEYINCDRMYLLNSLDYNLPKDQSSYMIYNNIKKVSNVIYFLNYKSVMKLWHLNLPFVKSVHLAENLPEEEIFPLESKQSK